MREAPRQIGVHIRRRNAIKCKIRTSVEHVFTYRNAVMGPIIRTIGIPRTEAKIGLANLAYNMHRLIFRERSTADIS